MICPKCGANIDDATLICPQCHEQVAIGAQRVKIADAKKNNLSILKGAFKSPVFLVLAIALSIMTLANLLSALSQYDASNPAASLFSVIFSSLPFIFSLISMIGAWKLYGMDTPTESNVKSLRVYSVFMQVICTIAYIAAIIATVAFGFVAITAALGMKETILQMWREGYLEINAPAETINFVLENLTLAFILLTVLFIILTVVLILVASAYKKSQRYLLKLADTCASCEYDTDAKFPYGILIFVAVYMAISAFGNLFVNTYSFIVSLAEIVFIISMAIFFKNIHNSLIENAAHISTLERDFSRIVDATNEEYLAEQRRKENAMFEAQERAAKAQEELARMMMTQTSTAGGMATDTPAEETPEDETPAEEAPAEEAPAEEAPAEDAPVEEAPVEDAPVEDAPVEEAPAEDAPVEETSES